MLDFSLKRLYKKRAANKNRYSELLIKGSAQAIKDDPY